MELNKKSKEWILENSHSVNGGNVEVIPTSAVDGMLLENQAKMHEIKQILNDIVRFNQAGIRIDSYLSSIECKFDDIFNY